MLVDLFHWSLFDLDRTDIESLIPFVFHYPRWKGVRSSGSGGTRQVFADEMEF